MFKFSVSRVLFFLFIVFLIIVGFLCCDNRENRFLRAQVRDLQLQLALGSGKVDTFFVRDSIPVWKERIVEIDKTDYKKELSDRELIKSLKLRLDQVESENRQLLNTRDTVYLAKDSERDSVLEYRDGWAQFKYYESSSKLEYSVRDSLSTFVSREYKHKFLWWRWGTKGYNVHIVNYNPHSRVEYNKYLRVK